MPPLLMPNVLCNECSQEIVLDRDQRIERMAQLVAQRAKRKMGIPRDLRLVGHESAPEPPRPPSIRSTLADWTALEAVDVSPRATKMHEIMHIANAYNWQIAVRHFLVTKGVRYLSDLTDPQLDDLLGRMHGYVDAAETGASLPDCLPAC